MSASPMGLPRTTVASSVCRRVTMSGRRASVSKRLVRSAVVVSNAAKKIFWSSPWT